MADFNEFKIQALKRLENDSAKTHKEFLNLLKQANFDNEPKEVQSQILSATTLKLSVTHTLTILDEYHIWMMKELQK